MNEEKVEILSQGIWMKTTGITSIRPEWEEWSKSNPSEAQKIREQAREMIGVAHAHAGSKAPTRSAHHHSLGWLP